MEIATINEHSKGSIKNSVTPNSTYHFFQDSSQFLIPLGEGRLAASHWPALKAAAICGRGSH